MLQFTRLRLAGFKSFVDPVELRIEPGMTGVVGPNGCGKSNLIEALRWVMGESSARQMRGAEMDDVIFGGSAGRPPRSVAEVLVTLDNSRRTGPPQYDADTIEVARRIDRGNGSSYRVNGRDVRARDVQLLFADAATGARSSGLVSQGRVASLINARPAERRLVLEEAAGIAGLHSRRHEAETRLGGAELNLERLDDVLATLAEQLRGLHRQARQAARYRALSERIRVVEARLLHQTWLAALAAVEAARIALRNTNAAVAAATAAAAAAAADRAAAAAILPERRAAATAAQDTVRAIVTEREQLEAEAGRVAGMRRDFDIRLAQLESDLQREQARAADAARAQARLENERDTLADEADAEADLRGEAGAALDRAAAAVAACERDLAAAMEEAAAADAGRAAALRRVHEAELRRDRLADRADQIRAVRDQVAAQAVDPAELTSLEMEAEAASEYLEEAEAGAEAAGRHRQEAEAGRDRAREALAIAVAARDRLAAEADALRQVLAHRPASGFRPLIEDVAAQAGYEPALAAALGDDLEAPADPAAPLYWLDLGPLDPVPPLPEGTHPLSAHVTAPPALRRRLGQIAVVADRAEGERHHAGLRPGQRLVTPQGDLWRWDGLVARAGAPSAMAIRLAQRNRLRELDARCEDAGLGVDAAEDLAATAIAAADRAAEADRAGRDAVRHATAAAVRARDDLARVARRADDHATRLAAQAEQCAMIETELAEAAAELAEAEAVARDLPVPDQGRDRLAALRTELADRRTELVEARAEAENLARAAAARSRRRDAIAAELMSWEERIAAARQHGEDLETRREALVIEIDRLAHVPDTVARRRAGLIERAEAAERIAHAAQEAVVSAELTVEAADRAARSAEQTLAACREERVRHEAAVAAADQTCRAVAVRIHERLEVTPSHLGELAAQGGEGEEEGGADAATPADLQRRLDRLTRDRDQIGPVNLCAEAEAAELEGRIAAMQAEKDDLIAAIARLRHGIAELNREARDKLQTSFQVVDREFRDLFVRLFGGGRAHLALTGSDDPLEAGLEIMASPPGKRLQHLSLLSGGEQALTALALLFAVFVANPAPICVLDEVDAPLDDANVDRFCTLVGDIAAATRTRFLIVTHHRMTMARMDRLYGVTMAERGVSQLVSVDLALADLLREPEGAAE